MSSRRTRPGPPRSTSSAISAPRSSVKRSRATARRCCTGWPGLCESRAARKASTPTAGWGRLHLHTQFATPTGRPGRVRVSLSRIAWGGPAEPGKVQIAIQPVGAPSGAKPFATATGSVGRLQESRIVLRTPRPPYTVTVGIDPTFSPADSASRISGSSVLRSRSGRCRPRRDQRAMNEQELRRHLGEAHRQLLARDTAFRFSEEQIESLRTQLTETEARARELEAWARELETTLEEMLGDTVPGGSPPGCGHYGRDGDENSDFDRRFTVRSELALTRAVSRGCDDGIRGSRGIEVVVVDDGSTDETRASSKVSATSRSSDTIEPRFRRVVQRRRQDWSGGLPRFPRRRHGRKGGVVRCPHRLCRGKPGCGDHRCEGCFIRTTRSSMQGS